VLGDNGPGISPAFPNRGLSMNRTEKLAQTLENLGFNIHSVEDSDIYESCINLAVTSDSDLWIGVSEEFYSVTYCSQNGLVDMPVVETMLELIDDIRTAINHIKREEVNA
jgi:hypothetical protein